MIGEQMLITAYVLAIGLLWGYALHLYLKSRSISRREQNAPPIGKGDSNESH